jgi:hypothetical protein
MTVGKNGGAVKGRNKRNGKKMAKKDENKKIQGRKCERRKEKVKNMGMEEGEAE